MRVLRGPKVALDESVFLAGMYKYKDKPLFPPLPSAACHRPSSPFHIGEGKRGKASYHRIAIKPTSISFWIFCAITGFFKCLRRKDGS